FFSLCPSPFLLHLFFLFLLVPPPLISTLFPYTTLFRSLPFKIDLSLRIIFSEIIDSIQSASSSSPRERPLILHSKQPSSPSNNRDRKSTRLNSSHVSISYAVFCLKKKKKKKIKKRQTKP